MITIGRYQLCFFDLIVDREGKISATKLWFHIGNIILSKAMLEKADMDWMDILAYGAVVAGSHVAIALLKLKFGNPNGNTSATDSLS